MGVDTGNEDGRWLCLVKQGQGLGVKSMQRCVGSIPPFQESFTLQNCPVQACVTEVKSQPFSCHGNLKFSNLAE